MNTFYPSPRSVLHALEPLGVGTPDTESLLSYFYRLAVSHCVSANSLMRKVSAHMGWDKQIERNFRWNDFKLNSSGEGAERWSNVLAQLTSVAGLHNLTMLPWRDVIAQKGLTATPSRWCPHCFAEDKAENRTPYFRLAWDLCEVAACQHHRIKLIDTCPECGSADARNHAYCVVPGWCTTCGVCLCDTSTSSEASPGEVWKAVEIGTVLATANKLRSNPSADALLNGISSLVRNCENGTGAAFARRLGIAKSSVTYWLKDRGVPTMSLHLRIASQCGVRVTDLLTADVERLSHPSKPTLQLTEIFEAPNRKESNPIDRNRIDDKLDEFACLDVPISVQEAARRLNVTPRTLYNISNERARRAGVRWTKHVGERSRQRKERIINRMRKALEDLRHQGKSTSYRQMCRHLEEESDEKFDNRISFYNEAKTRMITE